MQVDLSPTGECERLKAKDSTWFISGSNSPDTFKKNDVLCEGDPKTLKGVSPHMQFIPGH